MKKILLVILVVVGAYYANEKLLPEVESSTVRQHLNSRLYKVIDEQQTGYQVQGRGTVARLLSDDNDGSRHQRFIIELDSGQTLLIAHNIDIAARVRGLRPGDRVSFFGEYEWNDQGGVIHWTHRDSRRDHVAGWVEHNGRRYQ